MTSIRERRGPATPLQSPEQVRRERTEAYYVVLNRDRELRAHLVDLRRHSRDPALLARLQVLRQRASDDARLFNVIPALTKVAPSLITDIRLVARKFGLPGTHPNSTFEAGVLDLWRSASHPYTRPPSLRIAERQHDGPWKDPDTGELVNSDGTPVRHEGLISPYVLLPFYYTPDIADPQRLAAFAQREGEKLRQSILQQADDFNAEAKRRGYRLRSPRYKNPDALRLGAERLYQRIVKHQTYAAIADAEAVVDGNSATVTAVAESVRNWCRILNVWLP